MKYALILSTLFLTGCFIRIGIEDNCDKVTGIDPDQVAEVVTGLKEIPEGDLVAEEVEDVKPEGVTK